MQERASSPSTSGRRPSCRPRARRSRSTSATSTCSKRVSGTSGSRSHSGSTLTLRRFGKALSDFGARAARRLSRPPRPVPARQRSRTRSPGSMPESSCSRSDRTCDGPGGDSPLREQSGRPPRCGGRVSVAAGRPRGRRVRRDQLRRGLRVRGRAADRRPPRQADGRAGRAGAVRASPPSTSAPRARFTRCSRSSSRASSGGRPVCCATGPACR